MKRSFFSKVLSVFVSLFLFTALLPMTVLAADTTTVQINGHAMQNGVPLTCGEGTAVWDKDEGTLTLNNVTINQEASFPVLRADNGELKIILIGENTITSTTQRAFYTNSVNLTIQGTEEDSLIVETDSDGLQVDNGNLTIDGCKIDITSTNWGGMMCWGGTLTIQNGANIIVNSFENAILGENALLIKDSTLNATARSNYPDYSTTALSSFYDISIRNSVVTATANGNAANAIYAAGTLSIDNSELMATTTSRNNPYPALCAAGNIDIDHSSATVDSAGTIGIWSSGGEVIIQDSIAYVAAHEKYPAIRGDQGGATIHDSWIEAFGADVSPLFTYSDSAIVFDDKGVVNGSLILPGNITIGENLQLSIPEKSSITVPEGVTFTNHGQIELLGDLIVDGGTINCDSHIGGVATCTSKAICDICEKEYGDFGSHDLVKIDAKDPTISQAGNTEYWYCKICDRYFSDENGEHEISLEDTLINKLPKMISGMNQEWTKGNKEGLTFKVDTDIEEFMSVLVDQKELGSSDFEIKSGSTIITLNASYLETLSIGKHTLSIITENGTTTTTFTIHEKQNVNTGTQNAMILWIGLLVIAAGACSTAVIMNKKKNKKE